MKRLRIIGLALLALFALGAIASSTAFAGEEGFLVVKGKTVEMVIPKEGKTLLSFETTAHTAVTPCAELDPSVFTFVNDHHAEGTLHFLKCTFAGFALNSLGDKSGELLVLALLLICLINSATLLFGFALTLDKALHNEVPAAGLLLSLTGTIIGVVLPVAGNSKLWVLHFRGALGVQEITDCIDVAGTLLMHTLTTESNENKKAEAESVLADPLHLTFPENVELMDK